MTITRDTGALLASLWRGLIVSCQAEGDDPFNEPDLIARFARAADMGGAAAIRAREPANVRAIRRVTSLPILGLTKGQYPDGRVLITPDVSDVEALLDAGADLVAVDGTRRVRPNGLTGTEFIALLSDRWGMPLVADVATEDEGVAAHQAGAVIVATTLAGYTPETERPGARDPDWKLLRALIRSIRTPVILEGRVRSPSHASRALKLGAFAVVVGTAISRPRLITRSFVQAMT